MERCSFIQFLNYRMIELQGAVGLAQLRKLPTVVAAKREDKVALWQVNAELPEVNLRVVPKNSYETTDTLVFLVKDNATTCRCCEALLQVGLATMILPEAFTWHFAGKWHQMPELMRNHGWDLSSAFSASHAILFRAVSIPVGVKMAPGVPAKVRSTIVKVLSV
jgi:8-amino-3,8-dideoxy-alpha-D-manno-octulosonate transaminase